MLTPQLTPAADGRQEPFRWSRTAAAQALDDLADPPQPPCSQRAFAGQAGLPRSTLQYWHARSQRLDAQPGLAAFFESPAGLALLKRIALAAHLVFRRPALLRPAARRAVQLAARTADGEPFRWSPSAGAGSEKRLGALTVLHNYWVKRGDGTTAAQRFFGQRPADLFDWLLERFPDPPRPAQRRPKAQAEAQGPPGGRPNR
jgi:hypothetical protein